MDKQPAQGITLQAILSSVYNIGMEAGSREMQLQERIKYLNDRISYLSEEVTKCQKTNLKKD